MCSTEPAPCVRCLQRYVAFGNAVGLICRCGLTQQFQPRDTRTEGIALRGAALDHLFTVEKLVLGFVEEALCAFLDIRASAPANRDVEHLQLPK